MNSVLAEHFEYLTLPRRHQCFQAAIRKVIRPGDYVVDAGCGTGVLGLLCLQHGAAHIDAIDDSPAIELARESFARAGWPDKVTLYANSTFRTRVEKLADVLVCDHVGCFGFDYGLLRMITDARKRLLKPQARILPAALDILITAVDSQASYAKCDAWQDAVIPKEYHWIRSLSINSSHHVTLTAGELLCHPSRLASLNLYEAQPEFFKWQTSLVIERNGLLHGLAGCFNCQLAGDVWMTNSPAAPDSIGRAQAFLPIEAPLAVRAGDSLDVTISARPSDDVIGWSVSHHRSGRRFQQSSWLGSPLTSDQLARGGDTHVPRLTDVGRARAIVLAHCDGQRTAAGIKEAVLQSYPNLFPSPDETTRFIDSVLRRDTQ